MDNVLIMALVNHKHRWIFFHLYKCGGNSLRRVLNEIFPTCEEIHGVHSLPCDMKYFFDKTYEKGRFESYYKFTLVRNPFDFLVSNWFYAKRHPNHFWHEVVMRDNMDMEMFIHLYFRTLANHKNPNVRPMGSNKVVTLLQYAQDLNGDLLIDFIGKLEQMDKSQKNIFTKLKQPSQIIPSINISPDKEKDYRKYYNKNSQELAQRLFKEDLEYFNYKY